jgi:hypothetical protein
MKLDLISSSPWQTERRHVHVQRKTRTSALQATWCYGHRSHRKPTLKKDIIGPTETYKGGKVE